MDYYALMSPRLRALFAVIGVGLVVLFLSLLGGCVSAPPSGIFRIDLENAEIVLPDWYTSPGKATVWARQIIEVDRGGQSRAICLAIYLSYEGEWRPDVYSVYWATPAEFAKLVPGTKVEVFDGAIYIERVELVR